MYDEAEVQDDIDMQMGQELHHSENFDSSSPEQNSTVSCAEQAWEPQLVVSHRTGAGVKERVHPCIRILMRDQIFLPLLRKSKQFLFQQRGA